MKKAEIFLLLFIFALGLALRLYKFNSSLTDWHSWRQADTSSVSRIYAEEGINLLYPRFYDLSNVQSGVYDNPKGYRFVEFPIYNFLQAGGYLLFPILTIEQWGRMVSILSSLFSALFIFLILRRHLNVQVGLLGSFFYLTLPFSVFWGRTVLPDQTALMTTLGAIYLFDLYLNESKIQKKIILFFLSIIFFASALLLKPFTAFFFLPAISLALKKFGFDFLKKRSLWFLALLSVLPFVLWRLWVLQFPEGVPRAAWLFNGNGIRFTGAFFHWIFAERLGREILGFWGLIPFFIGVIAKYKNNWFFFSFLLSSLLYTLIVATGNVQHNYYQILIIPSVSIFLALGVNSLVNVPKQFASRFLSNSFLLVSLVFMYAFSWFEVRNFYNENLALVRAGKAIDEVTPKDAKVIAPNEGDTTLLYYTKRRGWASFSKPIDDLKRDGADYLVLFNPGAQGVKKDYKVVLETDEFIIFDINKSPEE